MWEGKQWLAMDLSTIDERKKAIMSFAIAAMLSGQLVDVGSPVTGCNAFKVADLQFIRVGDWKK